MARLFATTHIRSSVHVQPGQSGSPLLNSKGEVVGMVVCAMDDGSSTFALPITAARKIMDDLLKFHEARHGWTGISVEIRDLGASVKGLAVSDVYETSPAHVAGIRSGDVLLRIGAREIRSPSDVVNATFYLSVGETVNVAVQRDGEELAVPVRVAARPSPTELARLKMAPR